jgi:hypothetical protein
MRLPHLCTVAALIALPAIAQAQQRDLVEMLRGDVQAVKTQVLTEALQLPDSTAERFWPVYRQYSTDLAVILDGRLAVLRDWSTNYDSLTGQRATEIARRVLDYEKQRIELIQRYRDRVARAAGPLAAARFVQVEMLINKLLDVQIAMQLPLIGDRSPAPAHQH